MAEPRRRLSLVLAGVLVGSALVAVASAITSVRAQTAAFEHGDVLVTVGNGQVKHFTPSGRLVQILHGGALGETGALAFDGSGGFYVSDFTANSLSHFDGRGQLVRSISGLDSHPEAVVADNAGNVYVGLNDGTRELLRLDADGRTAARFQPAAERRGVDRADLASDQCTLYYTSEGRLVKRFDVCRGAQLSDFAALDIAGDNSATPTSSAYGLRIRPNGEVLVATSGAVVRLNPAGTVIRSYQIADTGQLVGLSLDPDLTSFWVADQLTGRVSRVDIESGDLIGSFRAEPAVGVGAVAVVGEVTAARPSLQLSVGASDETVGNATMLVATLVNAPPVEGRLLRFSVEGANPRTGTATTDSQGRATFSYVGERTGNDTVVVTAAAGATTPAISSRPMTVVWIERPATTLIYAGPAAGEVGQPVVLTARATLAPANNPLVAVPVQFRVGDAVVCPAAPTDAEGVATCSTVISGDPGRRTVTVAVQSSTTAGPATTTGEIEVARRLGGIATTLTYTGTGTVLIPEDATLSARLTDGRTGGAIAGSPLTFTVEDGGQCSAATDASGVGSCTLPSPSKPGQKVVTVTSAATPSLLGASTTGALLVSRSDGVVQTGRASALTAATALLSPIAVSDTGEVRAEGHSTTTRTFSDLPLGIVNAKLGQARVVTQPGLSRADAHLAELAVDLPGVLNLRLRAVDASSRSSCGSGPSGESRIAYLAVGPLVVFDSGLAPTPNTVLAVPGLSSLVTIVLNEQEPLPPEAGVGLTVNAVRIRVANLADIVVSSARSDLHNCPVPSA